MQPNSKLRFLCVCTQSQLDWLTGHSSSEGKRSKQEGLSMSCIPCCWRKYSSCRFGRTLRHIERTEHKKATKLSNLFPWRGQYKKKVDAFDLCPEINIPRKTTPLYLGICQMTPKLFPKVFFFSIWVSSRLWIKKPWFTARFQRGGMWRWVLNMVGRKKFFFWI